jgi:tetratricopeptide (TPR) repeat protein
MDSFRSGLLLATVCLFTAGLGMAYVVSVVNDNALPIDPSLEILEHGNSAELNDHAEPLFRSALNRARRVDRDGTLELRLLNAFGEYQMRFGRYEPASQTFAEAVKCATCSASTSENESRPSETARANEGLAASLMAMSRFEEALPPIKRSISLYESAYGTESRSLGRALGLLGDVQFKRGELEIARNAYERSVRILKRCDGATLGAETAHAMRALGRCLVTMGRDEDAKPYLVDSFHILEKLHERRKRFEKLDPNDSPKTKKHPSDMKAAAINCQLSMNR